METAPFITNTAQEKANRQVSRWLVLGVVMLLVQSLLGGVTRLTGSGLSITEWKFVHGAVPPLNAQEWQEEFASYRARASGQYHYQNADFTLHDFKSIFWWEWTHREWARLIGVVFLIGFAYFLVKKKFQRTIILPLILLFVLGACQGAVGWIMVASGLNPEDTHVSHIKLALHFMAAMLLACYTLWVALQLRIPEAERSRQPALKRYTIFLLLLLAAQLTYGAFMAGLKAAPAAPTWPTINGSLLPGDLHHYGNQAYSGLSAWTSNPIAVHLAHRCLAYLLFGCIIGGFILQRRLMRGQPHSMLAYWVKWPMFLALLQVALGIFTVLAADRIVPQHWGRFEWLAQLHQAVAMCLLLSLVAELYLLGGKASAADASAIATKPPVEA